MPLSEHEQRLLDQIERALYAEDPKFASTVRASDPRNRARRRLWQSAVLFVVGISLLFAGVIVGHQGGTAVGLAGFLIMFGAAVLAATSWKRLNGREPLRVVGSERPAKARTRARRGSLLDRMEQRWRRRDDERGR